MAPLNRFYEDSILNYEYIEEFITTNLGEDVKYRWSHESALKDILVMV